MLEVEIFWKLSSKTREDKNTYVEVDMNQLG